MKGKGAKSERETIIQFDEEDSDATIWTASEGIYKKMRKVGWFPIEDGERHAVFQVPKSQVRLPRFKSKAKSEAAKLRFSNESKPSSE